MRKQTLHCGYSLVEVLIAVAVLLIAIVGPMTIAAQGIKASTFTLEQTTAFFLAQEGIEAVFALRGSYAVSDIADGIGSSDPDTSWGWVTDGGADSVLLTPNGPCPPGQLDDDGESCSFGIDFRDSTIEDNITASVCAIDNEHCRLYDDNNGPAAFTHNSAGTASPYERIITVTVRNGGSALEVTSVVTWESVAFPGQTQSVELRTTLFDISYES